MVVYEGEEAYLLFLDGDISRIVIGEAMYDVLTKKLDKLNKDAT